MKLPPKVTSVFATGCFVITGATIGAPLLEEEELLLELELLLEELEELELLLDEELEELELDELELDELLLEELFLLPPSPPPHPERTRHMMMALQRVVSRANFILGNPVKNARRLRQSPRSGKHRFYRLLKI